MTHYEVSMDIVDDNGIHPYIVEVVAASPLDAESEAHLIATAGEELTVLRIVQVRDLAQGRS